MGGRGSNSGFLGGVKAAERKIATDDLETAYAFDKDGNVIFSTTSNSVNFVRFTKEQMEQMRGSIVTHNHPSGSNFSYEDIALMARTGMKEMRATGKNGTFSLIDMGMGDGTHEKNNFASDYYMAGMEAKENLNGLYHAALSDYSSKIITEQEFQAECIRLNRSLDEATGRWLETNAKAYGYAYNLEK